MQKLLSVLASVAAIILFAAVAVTSTISAAIFGVLGLVFFGLVMPALLYVRATAEDLRSPLGLVMRALPIAIALAWIIGLILDPDKYAGHDALSGFGFAQAMGAIGLVTLVAAAIWLSYRWTADFYRRCPLCLSVIRRKATRCRRCTGEVAPEETPRDRYARN